MSTTYTLPVKARTVTITCMATGYASAIFTETGVAGPPVGFRQFSGNKQTAPVHTMLPQPLVVIVTDQHFNPVPGVTVSWADSGKGGVFSSPTSITDAAGHASINYTTPATPGTIPFRVDTSGLKTVTFSATVTAQ
jgi:hypothetical protein